MSWIIVGYSRIDDHAERVSFWNWTYERQDLTSSAERFPTRELAERKAVELKLGDSHWSAYEIGVEEFQG